MRSKLAPLTMSGIIGAACVWLLCAAGCTSVTPAEQTAFDAMKTKADAAHAEACRLDKIAHPGGKILADVALAATGNGAVIPLASGLDTAAYTAFQASCDARAAANAPPLSSPPSPVTPGS